MGSRLRVVIDTNLLVSAIFWTGRPKLLLNLVRRGQLTFLTPEALLSELNGVLTSERKPFQLSQREADKIIDHLKEMAEIVHTQ